MSITKEFGKADMSFLTKVGENVDLVGDKLLAELNARFTRLTMTPQLAHVPVTADRPQTPHR